MNTIARFKSGMYMAAQSLFMLITAEKKLLFYFGVPALISLAIKVYTYNVFVIPMDSPLEIMGFTKKFVTNVITDHEMVSFALIALINFATTFAMVFFNIALVHHIAHIIQGDTTTFLEAFKSSFSKKKNVLSWVLITLGLELACQFAEETNMAFLGLILLLFIGLFYLATLFVVPLIALKHDNLRPIVAESGFVTRTNLVEIMGGVFWLALMIALTVTPFALLWKLSGAAIVEKMLSNPGLYPKALFVGIFISEIVLRCITVTAFSIFKVMIYQHHHRNFPDAEEIEMINYSQYF